MSSASKTPIAQDATRLELRVSVGAGAQELDLVVHTGGSDRVGELAAAAARLLGANPGAGLWCERRCEQLDSNVPLSQADIRWGDRLLLASPSREPTRIGGTARVELAITGGPCTGQRFELGDGTYSVGRGDVDIALSDPSLSRRHLELVVAPGVVRVADAESRNGTAINGQVLRAEEHRSLGAEDELELGRTLIRVRQLQSGARSGIEQRDGRLAFNRKPRVKAPAEPYQRTLPPPPSRGRKARLPLAASLLPLGAGVLLFVLLKSPVMLAIAGLSPLMAIGTYVSDRRGGKKSFAREIADFVSRLEETLHELDEALAKEAVDRRAESPDAPSLISRVHDLTPALWERRPTDSDFLCLRVGVADLGSRGRIELQDGGDQELRAQALERISQRHVLPSVPCVLNLCKLGTVGLAGPQATTSGLARWLLLQASVLHSPGELVVLAALDRSDGPEWSWLKWLPHLRPDRLGLQSAAIAVGRAQAEQLLVEIRDLAKQRRAQARAATGTSARPIQLLLLIDEATGVDRSLLSAALGDLEGHGIAIVWLGSDSRDLPGQTQAIIECEADRAVLTVTEVATGEVIHDVSLEALPIELAQSTARQLAPIRDIGELARGGDIPRRVGLLGLLGLLPPTAQALQDRWATWSGDLRSTVGVSADGALTLELRSEGPHALIAGTTGSGKSELLRTFVAAAAASAPPNRLSFLLVDYKGGAAFAPCASLPHVVDIVSDLDEHLAERALISLDAELKRRERVLAERGAKDLSEVLRRDADAAPPFLIIAVDEFAKLREEVPQFVDGVVDIAQRGRSLGVHMVLAAQTLRNAFTPAIRANTNLRLALRVAEEGESEDMIASPLAARIPSGERSRGRAFARTGHGELREFQAAYVSGSTQFADLHDLRIERYEIGTLADARETAGDTADGDNESDLVALGEAASEAQRLMGLEAPPRPWLPTLPETLALDRVAGTVEAADTVAFGLVDLPHLQRQDPLSLDLQKAGHAAIFGAGNSGKTTALTSLGIALASSAEPDRLTIYGLDAASGNLAPLQALPHCGGVLAVNDEERVQRLLRTLLRRIEWQGDRRGESALPGSEPGRVVLLLDDLGSFAHHYDRPGFESPYEQLQQILAGGRAAGVHVVLTASRRGALPAALAAHIGVRLVLRMTSEEDMLSLGLDAKTIRGAQLPPGRGFTQDSKEFQIAVPTSDGTMLDPERAIQTLFGHATVRAPRIEVLPATVARDSLAASATLEAITIGLCDEELAPAEVDLSEMHLLVIGPYRSGRSTTLATLLHGLRQVQPQASFHLLAPRRSALSDRGPWASKAAGSEACAESATKLLEQQDAGAFEQRAAFIFIDDGGELADAKTVHQLKRLVRAGRDSSLRVLAAVETGAARGIGNSWIRELRREGHGILLQPDLTADGDLLATTLPRRVAAPLSPGRGFLVSRGAARLIQVAS